MSLPLFDRPAIAEAAPPHLVMKTVREALIAHAEGRTTVPAPLHLDFPDAEGDCHVKAGWIAGSDTFTVKIATGFYRNHHEGLPSNHGLVCALDARTGRVRALLNDGGLLTALRTAAAGALITHALARPDATTLAVFGTGEQARLQVTWLARLRPLTDVLVHSRAPHRAQDLCAWLNTQGLHARPAGARAAAETDIIVTATPATTPVLEAQAVGEGTHVTGIGADMPHKNELPAALFGRAQLIATDDREQCLDHGDFGHAVRSGIVDRHADHAAGLLLKDPPHRPRTAITVADLTGVGALDAALSSAVLRNLLP
ncbi:ornithine cyclodeaminase family protein [Embleya scabrispora]|uniref:ornithine cyclodeaminase family protein n=1 Tax=Embleya scabrispora TaxID=159449 RepID=UPI000361FA4D|nr:ornithine cyclodeaminase family protein [Embleya scabrispora]MYS85797.1 ornithine cyclodeaminase family protein [Streptomyces sp. SID5474]